MKRYILSAVLLLAGAVPAYAAATVYYGISTADSPTFAGVNAPLIVGGALAGSSLSLKSTSGVGTTDYIKFLVGNNGATEAMRIIDSGNVGIGIADPNKKLDVNGDAVLNSGGPGSRASVTNIIGSGDNGTTGGYRAGIAFVPVAVNGFKTDTTFSSLAGDLFNSTYTENVRITWDGKVGIGDPAPATGLSLGATAPVHVSSGQTTAPALTSCGGGSPSIIGSDTAGTVTMGTTATGCVITFNVAYTGAPHCVVSWRATPLLSQSYTVSNAAITTTQTSTSGNLLDYICIAPAGG